MWLFIVHFFSLFSCHLYEPFCLAFKFLENFSPNNMPCHVARILRQKNRTPNVYLYIEIIDYWFFHYLIVPSYSTELTINWNLLSHLPFILSLFTYHRLCPESIYFLSKNKDVEEPERKKKKKLKMRLNGIHTCTWIKKGKIETRLHIFGISSGQWLVEWEKAGVVNTRNIDRCCVRCVWDEQLTIDR